jgi:L-amino acid N-acyltransferase YncA
MGGITLPNDASIALHEKFWMVKVLHVAEVRFKFNQLLDVGYWQGKIKVQSVNTKTNYSDTLFGLYLV